MLKDKVVVVTGGAGLLGQEFIRAIVKNNGTALIADIDEEKGLAVKKQISEELKSSNVDFVKIDITSKASIDNVINYAGAKYGKIDAFVNNAYPRNKNYGKKFFDVEYDDFCENTNLHTGGYFLCCQSIAKYFIEQGYGNIINMASVYGVIAPRFEVYENTAMTMPVEYAVIKSGIIHLTKYLAKLIKGKNIRVNCISPGGILNNQPEDFLNEYAKLCLTKGMLDKTDLSGALLFLLSDLSKYVNGQNIIVDDGFTL